MKQNVTYQKQRTMKEQRAPSKDELGKTSTPSRLLNQKGLSIGIPEQVHQASKQTLVSKEKIGYTNT